jgi:hypothetical protein
MPVRRNDALRRSAAREVVRHRSIRVGDRVARDLLQRYDGVVRPANESFINTTSSPVSSHSKSVRKRTSGVAVSLRKERAS